MEKMFRKSRRRKRTGLPSRLQKALWAGGGGGERVESQKGALSLSARVPPRDGSPEGWQVRPEQPLKIFLCSRGLKAAVSSTGISGPYLVLPAHGAWSTLVSVFSPVFTLSDWSAWPLLLQ